MNIQLIDIQGTGKNVRVIDECEMGLKQNQHEGIQKNKRTFFVSLTSVRALTFIAGLNRSRNRIWNFRSQLNGLIMVI